MNQLRFILLVVMTMPVVACDGERTSDPIIFEQAVTYAKKHVALYQIGDFDQIIQQFNPEYLTVTSRFEMEAATNKIPTTTPADVLVVGSSVTTTSDSEYYHVVLQYDFVDSFMIATVWIELTGSQFVVNGMNFQPMNASLVDINAFHLDGRGYSGYAILLLASLVAAFTLFTFVVCLRTPIPRKKWLWSIFVLIGFGTLHFDWTTGQVGYSSLSWQLFGTGFAKSVYSPLILSISIPIGAAIFWARRKEWQRKAGENSPHEKSAG